MNRSVQIGLLKGDLSGVPFVSTPNLLPLLLLYTNTWVSPPDVLE